MQTYYGSSHLNKVYYGDIPVNRVYRGSELVYIRDVTLTINPTPSDATVVLTAAGYTQSGNSITVKHGTTVTGSVSKAGYVSMPISITVIDDSIVPVSLANQYTLTITPTPQNATVVLTATGFTQSGNSILVDPGTSVHYKVSKTGYVSEEDDITVNATQNKPVEINLAKYTLTINPTPSDATVSFSTGTISGNSCTVDYGTVVTYTVSKTDYETKSEPITVLSDQTQPVSLDYRPYAINQVIFESAEPGTYSLNLLTPGTYNVICVGGGASGCACLSFSSRLSSGTLSPTSMMTGTARACAGGGSGGYSNSTLTLNSGTVSVVVGAGGSSSGTTWKTSNTTGGSGTRNGNPGTASSFGNSVSANGGNGGTAYAKATTGSSVSVNHSCSGGSGGTGTTTNGNSGGASGNHSASRNTGSSSCSGGASVYGGYGTGGGASANNKNSTVSSSNGSSGYVRVVFIGY